MPIPASVRIFLAFVLVLGFAAEAAGQQIRTRELDASGVSFSRFAEENAPTIRVLVAGQNAGLYEVEVGLQLDTFLALLGAPLPERSNQASTSTSVAVYRPSGAGYAVVYQASIQDAMTDAASPELAEDDRILVETEVRDRFGWRDAAAVFRTGVTFALLILRIRDYL